MPDSISIKLHCFMLTMMAIKTVYAAYIVTKKAAGPLDECRKKSKYRMPSVFSHTK